MANRGYMINSSSPTSDPSELERLRERPGHLDGVVAESSGRLLVPWFLCFRRTDLHPAQWRSQSIQLPVTTVEHAVRNLEASLPVFEAIAGDAALARPYWSLACTMLKRLPLPYISLDIGEILDLGVRTVEDLVSHMHAAHAGDLSAVAALKALSQYDDHEPPYPLDLLFAIATGVDIESSRTWNATVLDGGFVVDIGSVSWQGTDVVAPPSPPPLPDGTFGELYDVPDLLGTWAAAEAPSASGELSLVDGTPECIAIELYAGSDQDLRRLQSSAGLRSRLEALLRHRLHPWCRKYGFGWAGVRASAPEWARR